MSNNSNTDTNFEMFTFGEPEPVMDSRDLQDYAESYLINDYYEPPVTFSGLAKSFRSSAHHSSAIFIKRDILASCYIPHKTLSRKDFSCWVLDYLIFGNGFIERQDSRTGKLLKLQHTPSKHTRRMAENDRYTMLRGWQEKHVFKKGAVHHLIEPDINQEIYGMPQYLASLQSAWLNESATLFRRRYYDNGSHAGFILYMTDAAQDMQDVKNMRAQLKESKGVGNFKNLFMYAPNGKKDGIQIIPISEVQAKDEFFNIKNVSRDDILAAHRVPPQIMGIIPTDGSGFGSTEDAAKVFARNEVEPLKQRTLELNDWLGEEIIRYKEYTIVEDKDPN